MWTVHDTFAEAMASAYRDAAMAQVLRDERERSALVAALLEGRVLEDTTVWDIADLLRLARIAMATTAPGHPAVTLFDDHPLAVAAVSAPTPCST